MALSTSLAAQLRAADQQRQRAEEQRRVWTLEEYAQLLLDDLYRRQMKTDRHGRPVIDVEPIKEDDHGRTSGTTVVGIDPGTSDDGPDPVDGLPRS